MKKIIITESELINSIKKVIKGEIHDRKILREWKELLTTLVKSLFKTNASKEIKFVWKGVQKTAKEIDIYNSLYKPISDLTDEEVAALKKMDELMKDSGGWQGVFRDKIKNAKNRDEQNFWATKNNELVDRIKKLNSSENTKGTENVNLTSPTIRINKIPNELNMFSSNFTDGLYDLNTTQRIYLSEIDNLKRKLDYLTNKPFDISNVKVTKLTVEDGREIIGIKLKDSNQEFIMYKSTGWAEKTIPAAGEWALIPGFMHNARIKNAKPDEPDKLIKLWFIKGDGNINLTHRSPNGGDGVNRFFTELSQYLKKIGAQEFIRKTK